MGEFRYSFDSREKFECPSCGEAGRFVRYIDRVTEEYLEGDYGKCDRENNCGHYVKAPTKFVEEGEKIKVLPNIKNLYESSIYKREDYERFREKLNKPNVFMRAMIKRFGKEAAVRVWDEFYLANFYDGGIVFPYVFQGNVKTGKVMFYDQTTHRRKDKPEFWLHNYGQDGYDLEEKDGRYTVNVTPYVDHKFKLSNPLFNWDAIQANPNKFICLVEAPKSAIIGSAAFPEYVWVAAGHLQGIQPYKFPYNNNRHWIVFPDLGSIKYQGIQMTNELYWKTKLGELKENINMNLYFPKFHPFDVGSEEHKKACVEGDDVADYIMDVGYKYVDYLREILNKISNGNKI